MEKGIIGICRYGFAFVMIKMRGITVARKKIAQINNRERKAREEIG